MAINLIWGKWKLQQNGMKDYSENTDLYYHEQIGVF